jgi:hypothetical protein
MSNWQCINCGRSQGFKWSGNGCKANGGGLHIVREVQRAPKFSSFRGYRGDSGSIITFNKIADISVDTTLMIQLS